MRCTWNRPNLIRLAGVDLFPGVNVLTQEQAAAVAAHPVAQDKVAKGFLVMGEESRELSAKEMVEAIGDMNDVARLKELAEDRRSTVAAAAEARLKWIEENTAKDEE